MRKAIFILAAIQLAGCGGCDGGGENAPDAAPTFDLCDSDSQAWVRNAYLAIVGHRPHGQAEVDVYVQLLDQLETMKAENEELTFDPKAVVARAMTAEPNYVKRWTSHFIDSLRVAREDEQNMAACYGARRMGSVSPTLATQVRDGAPTTALASDFTMLDLVESSLALDDVTPIYRAHLFALVNFPIPAANVPEVQAELARREDFGLVFDSAYLNRDIVCLGCHNSEASVTDDEDPALDRHWPMAGRLEEAVYTASSGTTTERAHAVFRFDGFAAGAFGDTGSRVPWGWDTSCGSFYSNMGDDPAGVDGLFAGLSGQRLTVYELESALRTGLDALRGTGLQIATDGSIEDPTHAFAYLMAASIVEGVWKEVVGSGLTIANYFPRNEAQRDLLQSLTDRFVRSGYSLEDLLVGIVSSDYFSRLLPEDGCGASPYTYPNVYDPWVISDTDEARRQNGPGDSVAAVSSRTLMRTAYEALEWTEPFDLNFPGGGSSEPFCEGNSCADLESACNQGFCCQTYQEQCLGGGGGGDDFGFQQGVGAFMKNGNRGFRGLDFQARLVWEDKFGSCENPGGGEDFVDKVLAAAAADSTATVADVIAAVKDRLIGEPTIDADGDPSEEAQLEAVFGGALDRPASEVASLEIATRHLCGVLLSSPQFVLSGVAGRGGDTPKLTPAEWSFDTVCQAVVPRLDGGSEFSAACAGDGTLAVTAP